ncbi:uncharacterized protein LOC103505340 [Diaphorina citri]|uniref:Uncharacterized protein LOC103505340 n=1 Tax=Diaphorina citri TaxID=121845 RepID=A0A3Q0IPA1_DIACI|nr:uncharacterized protein LOC103505340 [Diaphorina citri]
MSSQQQKYADRYHKQIKWNRIQTLIINLSYNHVHDKDRNSQIADKLLTRDAFNLEIGGSRPRARSLKIRLTESSRSVQALHQNLCGRKSSYLDGRTFFCHTRSGGLTDLDPYQTVVGLKLDIEAKFLLPCSQFDYTFVSEIVSIGPRGYMTGYARDLVFHSVFVFDLESEQMHLESLELMEKGDVKVQVYVSKLVDWLANPVINWLATLYEEKLLILLQDVMKRIINEHLPPKEILFLNKQV